MKNDYHKCHLFYLIENGLHNDEYSGLSHVVEHALLIPTDIGVPFAAKGYTSASHVWLSFSSDELPVLREVNSQIMSMRVLTDESVNIAKEQVKWEIINQKERTDISCRIMNFITDGRITKHAIGELEQVDKIQTRGVVKWFSQRKKSNWLHSYLFNKKDEIIASTNNKLRAHKISKPIMPQHRVSSIQFLYLASPDEIRSIRIYFKSPSITDKMELMIKGLTEYCVQQRIAEKLGIEVNISDHFFNTVERYVVIDFAWNRSHDVEKIVNIILAEINNIDNEDYKVYKAEFINMLIELHPDKKSAHQIMNDIKNKIVYAYPSIECEDFSLVDKIDYISFLSCLQITGPIKVVAL